MASLSSRMKTWQDAVSSAFSALWRHKSWPRCLHQQCYIPAMDAICCSSISNQARSVERLEARDQYILCKVNKCTTSLNGLWLLDPIVFCLHSSRLSKRQTGDLHELVTKGNEILGLISVINLPFWLRTLSTGREGRLKILKMSFRKVRFLFFCWIDVNRKKVSLMKGHILASLKINFEVLKTKGSFLSAGNLCPSAS